MNNLAQLMAQNVLRNNTTGETYDLGPSAPPRQPQGGIIDYTTAPVDIGFGRKAYRSKTDPYGLYDEQGNKVMDIGDIGRSPEERRKDVLQGLEIKLKRAQATDAETTAKANQAIYGNMDSPTGAQDYNKQLDYWAQMIRNGGSMPPGLARGKAGSEFVREVAKRAALGETTPEEVMANQAEFGGNKAAQRTLGTRTANIQTAAAEAGKMMPIAMEASNNVDRTQYPTLNHVLLAVEQGTGDENVVKLAVATNSLINSYARAIAPTGVPTVHDKEHAREILMNAYSQGQYSAALQTMQQEIDAALASPGQVKQSMRNLMLGGKGATPKPATSGGFKYLGKE